MFVVFLGAQAVYAENNNEGGGLVTETGTHRYFKGALYQIWARLRSLNPKPQAERVGRGQILATAGVRGAESTESALKPYWKDDRTEDKAFIEQVNSLNAAQNLVDEGNIQEAGVALQSFVKRFPEGELLPNALFTQGLVFSAAGDKSNCIKTLKRFIKDYPQHPLKADAEVVVAELGSQDS